jgi:hypothetical protein
VSRRVSGRDTTGGGGSECGCDLRAASGCLLAFGACGTLGSVNSDIEDKTAQALDLLSPVQIVALYAGSLGLGDRIRSHPHPRKTNAAARGASADAYQTVLHHELLYGLPRRDPGKAELVMRELRAAQTPELAAMARNISERLAISR